MTRDIDTYIRGMEEGHNLARAIGIAVRYGQIDGDHHRLWVIDQMLRLMLGDGYKTMVELYEADGEYKWDTGIAP